MIKKSLTPLLLWAAMGLGAWSCRSALTADGIAAWTPGQSWLAALALLGLYALKGLTAAFPSTALAAAAGLVLPFPLALGTNLCGAAAAQAGPYFIGRRKQGALGELTARHPRLAALRAGPARGREVCLLRLAGVLPVLGAALWDLGGARFWASCVFGWALTGAALAVWGREWAVQPRSFLSRRISSPKKGRT